MSEWNTHELGTLLKDKGYIRGPFGSALKRGEMVDKGIPVYEQKNAIYDEREFRFFITHEKFQEMKRFQVKTNDLIISCSGTVGKISIIKEEDPKGIISQALLILRPDVEKITLKFLFYFLTSEQGFNLITQVSHGSVQINIAARKIVETIPVPIPPLPEQRAIASVLSSLDDKIDLLHRQNETLEKMAETLFRQWFVEEADESWEETTIKEFDVLVTDFVANGSFASLKENVNLITDRQEYALFVRNTDLKSGFTNKVYVDKHAYEFLSKTKLFGGEVIISSVGDVGSVFRCPKFKIPMTLGNNIIMLNSDYNLYFYLLFQSKYGQDMIYGITSGSVQQKFNKTAFRGLKINYPSLEYIADFESMVQPYFNKIDSNQAQIRNLTALRDTLLPKLMNGEVRVNYE
jgi:type I restriction enzyme S subunit